MLSVHWLTECKLKEELFIHQVSKHITRERMTFFFNITYTIVANILLVCRCKIWTNIKFSSSEKPFWIFSFKIKIMFSKKSRFCPDVSVNTTSRYGILMMILSSIWAGCMIIWQESIDSCCKATVFLLRHLTSKRGTRPVFWKTRTDGAWWLKLMHAV